MPRTHLGIKHQRGESRPSLTSLRVSIAQKCILGITFAVCSPSKNSLAFEHRDVSGELHWTSPSLQGAAGIGAMAESWVDQAQTDVSLLARRRATFEMELAGFSGLVSRDAVNTVVDTVNTLTTQSNSSAGSSSAAQSTISALNKVRSVFGKSMTLQTQAAFVAPRIGRVGIAPYMSGSVDASIDNAAWPTIDSYGGVYAGALVSYAQTIQKDFDLGVALRPGVGGYRGFQLGVSMLGDFMGSSSSGSSGSNGNSTSDLFQFPTAVYCPLDVAIGWWMNNSTRFHAVSKNTFDAAPLNNLSGSAGRLQSRINLGVVQDIPLPESKSQSLLLAGELQDFAGIKGGWNEMLLRLQVAGRYEVRLPFREQTTFAVNVGLHSGYPVASLFLDLFLAKLEIALSARENGGYAGQRPNRLMSAKVYSQMQF
ncbi:hypothetical protein EBU99_11200 [bacterium]|nr:hypothetical protein [bacterium]